MAAWHASQIWYEFKRQHVSSFVFKDNDGATTMDLNRRKILAVLSPEEKTSGLNGLRAHDGHDVTLCSKSATGKLEKINERAIRFVFRDKHTKYEELLRQLGLSTIQQLQQLCATMYLGINQL